MGFAGPTWFALEEEVLGYLGSALGNAIGLVLVIPHSLKAADTTKGRELDKEVGVKREKLSDNIGVAIGSSPIYGRCEPPLVPCAFPPQGEV